MVNLLFGVFLVWIGLMTHWLVPVIIYVLIVAGLAALASNKPKEIPGNFIRGLGFIFAPLIYRRDG